MRDARSARHPQEPPVHPVHFFDSFLRFENRIQRGCALWTARIGIFRTYRTEDHSHVRGHHGNYRDRASRADGGTDGRRVRDGDARAEFEQRKLAWTPRRSGSNLPADTHGRRSPRGSGRGHLLRGHAMPCRRLPTAGRGGRRCGEPVALRGRGGPRVRPCPARLDARALPALPRGAWIGGLTASRSRALGQRPRRTMVAGGGY